MPSSPLFRLGAIAPRRFPASLSCTSSMASVDYRRLLRLFFPVMSETTTYNNRFKKSCDIKTSYKLSEILLCNNIETLFGDYLAKLFLQTTSLRDLKIIIMQTPFENAKVNKLSAMFSPYRLIVEILLLVKEVFNIGSVIQLIMFQCRQIPNTNSWKRSNFLSFLNIKKSIIFNN